jgi:UMF1 family MFS transporter
VPDDPSATQNPPRPGGASPSIRELLARPEVLSFSLYDSACSAYLTSVATALLPAYFAAVVAPKGALILGSHVPASSLWGYAVSLAAALVFVLAPALGAAADAGGRRGGMLAACCAAGSAAVMLLGFAGPGDAAYCLGVFVLAHVAFAAGNAFYDSFLPTLAAETERDRISGLGYAFGYAGGGLNLILCLALVSGHAALGLDQGQAVRLAMALAGAWWLAMGLYAIRGLPASARPGLSPGPVELVRLGFTRAGRAAREARNRPRLFLFLLAYFFYNDGIQTVIAMSSVYGQQEIGLTEDVLILTLLFIQAIALAGALLFARLAGRIGAARALMVSLALWTLVAILAWGVTTAGQFFALGALVGVALGGSQALSRSVFSRLVPPEEPALYFGFFSVLTKLSAILGPLVFALVGQATGSARPAIASLVVFFAVGLALLSRLGEVKADA